MSEIEEGEQIARDVLVGLVACGVLAGDADGQVLEEELDSLVEVVASFLEGMGLVGDPADIRAATAEVAQQISDMGAPEVLAGLPHVLADDESRRLGCMVAVAVLTADEDVDRDEERMYATIARTLGFSEEESDEIWNEVVAADDEDDEGE